MNTNSHKKQFSLPQDKSKIPAIVIFGATACGKTEFAVSVFGKETKTGLANTCEIINADSVQVYKDAVIASAGPTLYEKEQVPHHLVSIYEGDREFSTSDFVREADKLCLEICKKNKVPVLLGGTAFFLKNFLMSLPSTPKADPKIRKKLQAELEKQGEEVMFAKLKHFDPVSASRINIHDHYRVLRALEVYEATKKPLSSFSLSEEFRKTYDFLIFTLTRERKIIYERINKRVDKMFTAGLVAEFAELYKKGYTATSPIMKAIGYKEFFSLSPILPLNADLDAVKNLIKRNTRRYAKRQETFFKTIPESTIVNLENPSELNSAIQKIKNFVATHTQKNLAQRLLKTKM